MPNAIFTLLLLAFIGAGILLLWIGRIQESRNDEPVAPAAANARRIIAWVLLTLGILGLQVQFLLYVAPIAWLITIVAVVMAFLSYRTGEHRTFVTCLAAAAERGIPLEQTARAFAFERSDDLGARAARLAQLLESGVPLPQALSQMWMRIPFDVLLATRLGTRTGDLSGAVRKLSSFNAEPYSFLRSIIEKCFYLILVSLVLFGILVFLMLKIVPVYDRMFSEFDLELPKLTLLLIYLTEKFANFWFLATPVILPMIFIAALGWLHVLHLLPRDIPILNWFSLSWDAALIMRSLALAVRQQRPFQSMIQLLAEEYPRDTVRGRLRNSLLFIEQGGPWQGALREAGLLTASEEGVLNAAQRSGNLEWALDEMADSRVRRVSYRLRLAMNVAVPGLLIFYGIFIGFVVIALFLPLIRLIQGLT